ncbi:ATP-dependent RNA helicase HrpA [Actinomyces gaoshouyii]|uniref:ATP-dependent RNA helicase HrpA n=1 Tax=Actinomyces gaoshouyii TaxID=1960083 RepID=UPI0009C1A742|nr:ATP-dependent RNA helicase HrpA [Actinomyces gaoshouyii]ARD42400.1 ATP-dependent RNA helicase HrpA [Actinomyces gaoshouyii]
MDNTSAAGDAGEGHGHQQGRRDRRDSGGHREDGARRGRRPAQQQDGHGRPPHGNRQGRRPRRPWAGFTADQLSERTASVPEIVYPDELPVTARRAEIAEAIQHNQVVIVAGETGSGKTTQIPKICLELGRGITGMIGHTQPRRIAARSVAERIADELGTRISSEGIVGYQVRFTEEVGARTLIKLMTDGILLAEIQSDPTLARYDTIIVDEAHERSLNIDFILGYLARLLPSRPDLKVIITSATIDSERFAEHFGAEPPRPDGLAVPDDGARSDGTAPTAARVPAPIIEVTGRTYPVEIRYRPLSADEPDNGADAADDTDRAPRAGRAKRPEPAPREDRDQVTGILDAVDELLATGPGDILVFLAGERDIRDTESALADHLGPRLAVDGRSRLPGGVEVVPLYSRLSAAEQHRVFEPHSTRRIVLATNVAETSLTVPGIRYVIDPGLARISRYSNRTKVQRLPIEPISQASANQRSGRCGRLADGVAIRLYSEADFDSRPQYTEPEILRTSLASVILQMAALGLGAVEDFPFIDAPDRRAVRDGIALLAEIGAIDPDGAARAQGPRLTTVGRRLARLPIDPRLGRMLLEAGELGCAGEVLVIVAALSIQDVRERPVDKQEASDALHRRFADPTSDFLTYLNLWRYLRTQSRELSGSAFRRMCRAEFLHYLRIREWQDVHAQLRQMSRQLGLNASPVELPTARAIRAAGEALEPGSHAAQIAHGDVAAAVVALGRSADTPDADAIHRSLLVGLLSNVGNWDERRREYAGARGTRFTIWPGSGLRRKTYDWVMTAELVETSRLFARTVAKVDERWIEEAAGRAGLLRRVHGEPYWSTRRGAAMVHEKVMLYGMTLVADRPSTLASVGTESARQVAREMFIRSGLVEGGWHARHGFVERNRELREELEDVERRRREHGLLASDEALFDFYDDRLPENIHGAADFDAWWKRERSRRPDLLDFTRELLLPDDDDATGYPDTWTQGDLTLGLEYVFEPGRHDDGVTVRVPIEVLGRLEPTGFDWLVPGMRPELVVATIRALPKRVRRQLVPAPDVGAQAWAVLQEEYPTPPGASCPDTPFEEAFAAVMGRLRGVEISDDDWAEAAERLPDHLSIAFAALDARGRALGRGKDLVALQRRLSGRTEEAVRSAVRGALAQAMEEAQARSGGRGGTRGPGTGKEGQGRQGPGRRGRRGRRADDGADPAEAAGPVGPVAGGAGPTGMSAGLAERAGLEEWPSGLAGLIGPDSSTIPATVESTGTAGLVVRGYPALVASGGAARLRPGGAGGSGTAGKPTAPTADLTILSDAVAQGREHPAGVIALALAHAALPTGRITSRWSGRESLTLAASPYRSTEALVTDLQLAAARAVAEQWASGTGRRLAEVREKAVFDELAGAMREGLEDGVHRIALIVVRVLEAQREVQDAVDAHTSLALLTTLQEVREQAAALIADGFITATPASRLQHLPRYLKALAMRVERAASSPSAASQDAALAHQAREALAGIERARERTAALPPDAAREAALAEARWMVEELRVSLFAQTLGTSQKVSPQRISKLLATI